MAERLGNLLSNSRIEYPNLVLVNKIDAWKKKRVKQREWERERKQEIEGPERGRKEDEDLSPWHRNQQVRCLFALTSDNEAMFYAWAQKRPDNLFLPSVVGWSTSEGSKKRDRVREREASFVLLFPFSNIHHHSHPFSPSKTLIVIYLVQRKSGNFKWTIPIRRIYRDETKRKYIYVYNSWNWIKWIGSSFFFFPFLFSFFFIFSFNIRDNYWAK